MYYFTRIFGTLSETFLNRVNQYITDPKIRDFYLLKYNQILNNNDTENYSIIYDLASQLDQLEAYLMKINPNHVNSIREFNDNLEFNKKIEMFNLVKNALSSEDYYLIKESWYEIYKIIIKIKYNNYNVSYIDNNNINNIFNSIGIILCNKPKYRNLVLYFM